MAIDTPMPFETGRHPGKSTNGHDERATVFFRPHDLPPGASQKRETRTWSYRVVDRRRMIEQCVSLPTKVHAKPVRNDITIKELRGTEVPEIDVIWNQVERHSRC